MDPRHVPETNGIAPSFAAIAGPAAIQVWSVEATDVAGRKGWMRLGERPSLRLAICSDWGEVKEFKWCPVLKEIKGTSLGLLAAVWGDGTVRVLDLMQEGPWSTEKASIKFERAAFTIEGQNTVATCLDWISSNLIAVGFANGYLGVWDISSESSWPLLYHSIHQTYITAITSGYPSRPSIISTTSMDGYSRITSISAPQTEYVFSNRTRVGGLCIAWQDHIHGIIAPDEGFTSHISTLRRFGSVLYFGRHAGSVECIATAACHPMVLCGGTEGEVNITNPLRKLLYTRAKSYQQTWFAHEYSSKSGVVRILDGFRLENIMQARFVTNKTESGNVVMSTVFEERSAITQVAWNPNLACGGWAAAAMGSGLIRIEDLAI
jgi:transcription factor C subunit 6